MLACIQNVQIGTPWADGTASISQCPIESGGNFTYEFLVDKVITNQPLSKSIKNFTSS